MAGDAITAANSFSFDGAWWDPEGSKDARRAQGRLTFAPLEGVTLEAYDWHPQTFSEKKPGMFIPNPLPRRLNAVHGTRSGTGEHCTLLDVTNHHHSTNGAGTVESWHSYRLLYGAHIDDIEKLTFTRAEVRLRGLREWVMKPWREPTGQGYAGLTDESKSIDVDLHGATLSLQLSRSERGDIFTHTSNRDAFALFTFDESINLHEFNNSHFKALRDLVALGTREQTRMEGMTLLFPDEDAKPWWGTEEERNAKEYWKGVEVVECTDLEPLRRRDKTYEQMLFTAATLGDEAPERIAKWFEVREKLAGVGNALFGVLDMSYPSVENQLLGLMAVAEGYHRVLDPSPRIDKKTHKALRKKMLAVVDDPRHQKLYKDRLIHANEQSQPERMEALFARAGDAVERARSWAELPRELVRWRNDMTHWPSADKTLAEPGTMWAGTIRLLIVLQANLMLDMEMDRELVGACVESTYGGHAAFTSG